jgi:hypothetical protein
MQNANPAQVREAEHAIPVRCLTVLRVLRGGIAWAAGVFIHGWLGVDHGCDHHRAGAFRGVGSVSFRSARARGPR